jgi:hypothetical protein
MNRHQLILYGLTILFETLLCALVYLRSLHKRLPLFAAHSTLLLAGTAGLLVVYQDYGFRSTRSYDAYWLVAGLIMVARGFAIAELCRFALRSYAGIWALSWRVLSFVTLVLMANAVVDAWGQIDRIAIYGLTIERDFAILSVVLLVAILLIRHYYQLQVDPLQKWVTVGMFLTCAVDVVNNTLLHQALTGSLSYWLFGRYVSVWSTLQPQVEQANGWFSAVRLSAFFISMSIWCLALRKPLPVPAKDPQLLPAELYGELSPAINLRLRAFNDRLVEMLQ